MTSWLTVPQFSQEAEGLRKHFEGRFQDPRSTDAQRFVWDPWHVPGQYSALRTPAYHFFPKSMYERFHRKLVQWGRDHLGCHDVSPPWLSLYLDGAEQRLHGDLPHGPWAFVYSLTRWPQRRFQGGETLILRPETLDYWRTFRSVRSVEEPDILQEIPSRFNQLLVFDPRLPHGVRRVSGVQDPREGRLVIHGWYVQPKPILSGPLRWTQFEKGLAPFQERLGEALKSLPPLAGVASFRLQITPSGQVAQVLPLVHNLRWLESIRQTPTPRRFVQALRTDLSQLAFARAKTSTRVTLPLVFSAE
jgi:hypothetical protein